MYEVSKDVAAAINRLALAQEKLTKAESQQAVALERIATALEFHWGTPVSARQRSIR